MTATGRHGAGRAVCLVTMLLLTEGCAGRQGARSPDTGAACRPVEGQLSPEAPWDSLTGTWRLTLVATSGTKAGQRSEGLMTLRPRAHGVWRLDSTAAGVVTVPVVGHSDIALEQVDAVRIGDVQSTDSLRPGLAVWVSRGPDGGVSAVLRIGQEALRTDIVRFDGGYTALYLREVSPTSLRGGWSSAVTIDRRGGYFCAVRAQ